MKKEIEKRWKPVDYYVEKYGMKRDLLYKMIRDRQIGHTKATPAPKGLVLIDEIEFKRYLDSNEVKAI